MTLKSQIDTARDAAEFLTGQWNTKPSEAGFAYTPDDLANVRPGNLIDIAHTIADEIDSNRKAKA